MQSSTPISALMFATLIIVLVIAAVVFVRFMSKRRNRHPMAGKRERNINEIRRDGPTR